MIKKLLSIVLTLIGLETLTSQNFNLVYQFSAVTATPNTGTVDPTPTPTAVGVNSGSFTANGIGTAPTTTNVFAFTSWTTGTTPELTKYFEITLTPQQSYVVTLNQMSFYAGRSNTGPQKWCVRTNKDSYTSNAVGSTSLISASSTGSIINVNANNEFNWGSIPTNSATVSSAWRNNCLVTFDPSNCSNQFTPFNIRFYAFNATSNAGSFRIDSVVIYGNATYSLGVGLNKITHDINAKIKLYPNPANEGYVTIDAASSDYSKIEVINVLGAVVASHNNTLAEEKIKLNLATLPEGTYFVKVTNGNKYYIEKLIVTK